MAANGRALFTRMPCRSTSKMVLAENKASSASTQMALQQQMFMQQLQMNQLMAFGSSGDIPISYMNQIPRREALGWQRAPGTAIVPFGHKFAPSMGSQGMMDGGAAFSRWGPQQWDTPPGESSSAWRGTAEVAGDAEGAGEKEAVETTQKKPSEGVVLPSCGARELACDMRATSMPEWRS